MNERVVAFIVARLSSSRLPRKQLKKIGSRRLLDWTIDSVKKSRYVDDIVIATTQEEDNKPLIDIAKEHRIDIFLYDGDINDVVGRLTKAAGVYKAGIPILISGDCPLIWSPSLDKLIEKILSDKDLDFVGFCPKDKKPIIHEGMGVFRRKCWELANKLSDKPNLREHQFPIVGLRPDLFKVGCVYDDEIFYKVKHRVSVDTLADLEFMNTVYNELEKKNEEFNMLNLVSLLLEKPYLMDINRDVHQIQLEEKQKKALIVVERQENLELLFDLAYYLTKKGVGVRFFSEDNGILKLVENKGFGIIEKQKSRDFDFEIKG
ncbi:cytidylyltransferase domain-containing protein [Hippea maritima]|uniref:Acylneuraminate cytidylyltransferase n=1 Tax=Hippea maritima (strain ATCC 700847 / DSM 10411 / MH2) TaxID=760142 RepID=F2LUL7_HIPMA|nr:acylneuraminate cytidylyltransferase [Hippea maritima]AEA34607.1 acylneuraminate cytidylyltransferase [Hippea maritima DSM 10411]